MKTEVNFGWGNDEERLRRWVKLSPKKKLEWLYQAHMLMRKTFTKKQREIFWKLRQTRQA
jgi:hypothetical protein